MQVTGKRFWVANSPRNQISHTTLRAVPSRIGLCDPASWSLQNRLDLLNGKSLSDATFQMVHGGDFLLTSLWMLWTVNSLVEDCSPLEEQKLNRDLAVKPTPERKAKRSAAKRRVSLLPLDHCASALNRRVSRPHRPERRRLVRRGSRTRALG